MNKKTLITLLFTLIASIQTIPGFAQSAKRSDASIRAESMKFDKLGRKYRDSKQYDKSEIMFKKSIKLDVKNEYAWSNLALIYLIQKKYNESKNCSLKALELDPDWLPNSAMLGWSLFYVENYFEAEKVLMKVVALESKTKFESRVKLGDSTKFNSLYLTTMREAYLHLGILNVRLEKYNVAEQMFKKTIELDLNYLAAYKYLGKMYSKMKKYDEAVVMLEKVLKETPKDSDAYCDLGSLYSDQGKDDLAEYMFQRGVECDPKNGEALVNLGVLYTKQKRNEEAEKIYIKAIDVDPHNVGAFIYLGLHYERLGKLNIAEYMYSKALQFDPHNGQWVSFLADVQLALGKREEAIKNAKIAKSKGVKNPELYEKLGL